MCSPVLLSVKGKLLCLKLDCATTNLRSFIGINVQFRCKGRLIVLTLGVVELFQSHTADYIQEIVVNVLKEYDVTLEQVINVTTDNGANIVAAVRKLDELSKESQETAGTSSSSSSGKPSSSSGKCNDTDIKAKRKEPAPAVPSNASEESSSDHEDDNDDEWGVFDVTEEEMDLRDFEQAEKLAELSVGIFASRNITSMCLLFVSVVILY